MIQSTVPDKAAGDPFTEAMWDTYIKDNLNGLSAGGTTIPTASLINGRIYMYEADTTNGVVWMLRYRSASASSYKWEFAGGRPLVSTVETQQTTTSGAYVDLATVGPQVTIPRAGDYDVEWGSQSGGTVATSLLYVAVKRGAAATADADSIIMQPAGVNYVGAGMTSRIMRMTGLAASTVLKLQYKTNAGTASFDKRWIKVTPVRVI